MTDFNWPPDVLSLKYGDIQKQYMDVMQCLKCKIPPDGRGCLKPPSLASLSTEELVERFLLLFVLDGISKSDFFKRKSNIDKQPLCDILTSETQALISEVLSCLQNSLMQDRIFYQHGFKIICDSIRHCLYSFDNIKITGPDSAKWYQALLDYKRSGIMTSKERAGSMQELSFETMDKICEGVAHQLETQSSFYYNLDSKGRYIFQRDLQLTPLNFFLLHTSQKMNVLIHLALARQNLMLSWTIFAMRTQRIYTTSITSGSTFSSMSCLKNITTKF